MKANFKGSAINMLFSAAEQNPEMSVGEILYTVLNKNCLNNKHFLEATDEEIYNSLERFLKDTKREDEPMNDVEWQEWLELKFPKAI